MIISYVSAIEMRIIPELSGEWKESARETRERVREKSIRCWTNELSL